MTQWKTATSNLTAAEGVDLILDTAAGVLESEPDGTEYDRGIRDGFLSSLAALLSNDERAASEILAEALRVPDRVIVVDTVGGHSRSIDVYGPYSPAALRAKLDQLRTQGVDVDGEDDTVVLITELNA